MNAVIMAGGEGSRLRPLTCDKPKPMMNLCGKPIMLYILDLLIKHGIESSTVTVKYLADNIIDYFESGEYRGHKLKFVREDKPLGTAGSVKNAMEGINETFIVISGDAMCDFDLTKAIKFHRKNRAAVTILTSSVEDPREYGLVSSSSRGRVLGFIEKPGWSQSVCSSANTGIYIIEPECMRLVPDGEEFDFAKDLFPKLLSEGAPVFSFQCDGYWQDIGNIEAYLKCQRDMLNNKIKCEMPAAVKMDVFARGSLPNGEYEIIPPVYIGNNVKIGRGAVIGPETVIEDGCRIGEGSKLRYGILGKGSVIGDNSNLTGCVTGENVKIKNDVSVFENCAIGSGATIGSRSVIYPAVLVWPQKTIAERGILRDNLKYGIYKKELFDDDGANGDVGFEMTAEKAVRLGCAIGSSDGGSRVGIACCDGAIAEMLKNAVTAGLMSCGSQIWQFGECPQSELKFLTAFCGLSTGIYICNKISEPIKVFGEYGLSLPRYAEREIESNFVKGGFAESTECKKPYDMSSMHYAYESELANAAGNRLEGISAAVRCADSGIREMMNTLIERLGGTAESGIVFRINKYGSSVSAKAENGETIPFERLLLIVSDDEMKNGNDITLPYDSPEVIERMALRRERKVNKYLCFPCDKSDRPIRCESVKYGWAGDGLVMTMKILGIMKKRNKTLSGLSDELPTFAVYRRACELGETSVCGLSDLLGADGDVSSSQKEGITLKSKKGRVIVRPNRLGTKVNIISEAVNTEIAKELCDDISRKLAPSLDNGGKK